MKELILLVLMICLDQSSWRSLPTPTMLETVVITQSPPRTFLLCWMMKSPQLETSD